MPLEKNYVHESFYFQIGLFRPYMSIPFEIIVSFYDACHLQNQLGMIHEYQNHLKENCRLNCEEDSFYQYLPKSAFSNSLSGLFRETAYNGLMNYKHQEHYPF